MGIVNLLEVAFKRDFVKVIIVVTTDKVLQNENSGRAFMKTDPLEDKDPYSASKVGTEAAVVAWQRIAKASGGPLVISVRTGNVIGGGEFADNRLIPDIVRGTAILELVEIRSPESVRPWQQVLVPLHGYLITRTQATKGEVPTSINFGPKEFASVRQVADVARSHVFCEENRFFMSEEQNTNTLKAQTLSLDSSLAAQELGWTPLFDNNACIYSTFDWWGSVLNQQVDVLVRTRLEI
jgi:CDP-glucose 4,6-dehydratase